MTIDGIDKILSRAKHRIKMESIFLKEPSLRQLKTRLPVVHKIIYLIFNEGHRIGSGKEIIRQALCEESLIMTKVPVGQSHLQRRYRRLIRIVVVQCRQAGCTVHDNRRTIRSPRAGQDTMERRFDRPGAATTSPGSKV